MAEMVVNALLTNKTFLMKKNESGKYEELIGITKYPQIGGEPEQIEVTTLRDVKKRYINGLEDTQKLEFGANYTKENYSKLNAIVASGAVETYCLCFGDELGTDGRFEWSGRMALFLSEGESNAARGMTFTISDEGDQPISEVEALTSDDLAA